MKKTLFIDIDGTLIIHKGNQSKMFMEEMKILPDVLKKFNKWDAAGHKIILTTGRKECLREITHNQLLKNGIFYDQLVMGINRGERIMINDNKPLHPDITTASAIVVDRNEGIKNIKL